jgi:ankyrin repeat protein
LLLDGVQDGRTPLHLAAEHGHLQVATALVCFAGADLTAKDSSGQTALHVAVDRNNLALAKALMDWGAATDATANVSAGACFLPSSACVPHSVVLTCLCVPC